MTKATQKKAARDERAAAKTAATQDSFQNFALNLGLGTDNGLSSSTYGFNPITRVRTLLEWIHRGSWLGGVAIDLVAEDMTREGIEIESDAPPDQEERVYQQATRLGIWEKLCDNIKWARLYGGSLAFMMIDGQDPSTPLRLETVGRGAFRGLFVLDRWMVEPQLNRLVAEPGPDFGLPTFYRVTADAPALPMMTIHYSRCLRLEGIHLPYWQRVMENLWGISVIERLYDRMVAFDSATTGAAQLANKSYIRTYKIDQMRTLLATGGQAEQVLMKYVQMMRRLQGIEGVTLIDGKDEFVPYQVGNMAGMSDVILQLGQQISGALQIPLVRLFGQSPAGLNSTGESDLRMYYDGVKVKQERDLRTGVRKIYTALALSEGVNLGDRWNFSFKNLWQMADTEKAQVDTADTNNVLAAQVQGVIDLPTALKELQQRGRATGRWTNITDDVIADAEVQAAMPPIPGLDDAGNPVDAGDPSGIPTSDALPRGDFGGVQIVVEHRAGERRWHDGPVLPADYGYIRRVPSAEGPQEWMDCFVGPVGDAQEAWVADAYQDGVFDEHKVMLGFGSEADARRCFDACYDGTRMRLGYMTPVSMSDLRRWLSVGDVRRAYHEQAVPRAVA